MFNFRWKWIGPMSPEQGCTLRLLSGVGFGLWAVVSGEEVLWCIAVWNFALSYWHTADPFNDHSEEPGHGKD